MSQGGEPVERPEGRSTVYCLIPGDLPEAQRLDEILRRHFRDDPNVEVVIERRRAERRSGADRRYWDTGPSGRFERRAGEEAERRRGERRAPLVPVGLGPVPSRAIQHADSLTFVERLERYEAEHPRSLAGWEIADALQAAAETWRRRYLEAERDSEELVRALIGVVEAMRRLRIVSPTGLLPGRVREAERAIDRYRERRSRRSAE
jgi:hypothetical protein